jgi:hypothetical protein
MSVIGIAGGLILIVLTLLDGFETMLQPRRVTHRFRFARTYYRYSWSVWHAVATRIGRLKWREAFLGVFGPLSLLGLFASWIAALIVGFALLHWGLGTHLRPSDERPTFPNYLYLSGTTYFTLGYGDITPISPLGRILAVVESGMGFGFLAVIVSYLPVLSQAFSRREVIISLLDARAGSPPSATQLLLRLGRARNMAAIETMLMEWEHWAAELFPVLSYYRSQHDNQSWLTTLATMLDTCALLIAQVKGQSNYQAQLTFAMSRHAAVDLALVLRVKPKTPVSNRLSEESLKQLGDSLRQTGLTVQEGPAVAAKLTELRGMYEPFLIALAERFLFELPDILPAEVTPDNWQRSAWMRRTPGIGNLPVASVDDEHFE